MTHCDRWYPVRLAETLGQRQVSIAKLEKRGDLLLSTLRRYVEAMGGRLSLVVETDHLAQKIGASGLPKQVRKGHRRLGHRVVSIVGWFSVATPTYTKTRDDHRLKPELRLIAELRPGFRPSSYTTRRDTARYNARLDHFAPITPP